MFPIISFCYITISMGEFTPMLQQYKEIKSLYRDYILFFRLGDFYEMFFDDAKVASQVLDVVLTSRTAGKMGRIPMCGIPFHSAENYIAKLIRHGYKVAICEQVQDPKTAKGLVRREVVRVVTPGTFIDEDPSRSSVIVGIYPLRHGWVLGVLDMVKSELLLSQAGSVQELVELLLPMDVGEVVYPESRDISRIVPSNLFHSKPMAFSPWPDWNFDPQMVRGSLPDSANPAYLSQLGLPEEALRVVAGLVSYARDMTKTAFSYIKRIGLLQEPRYVYIQPTAIAGLGLEDVYREFNYCQTAMGKRTLKEYLFHPLTDKQEILSRQEAIKILQEKEDEIRNLRDDLKGISDIEKALSRILCGYKRARDLISLRNSLVKAKEVWQRYQGVLRHPLLRLHVPEEITDLLERALVDALPSRVEGNLVRSGFSSQIDRLRDIQARAEEYLRNLQAKEIKRTGISSLRIGYNKVFGYYIEVTKPNLHLVPKDYIRKQTLVNAERFITEELKRLEEQILSAGERLVEEEGRVLEGIYSSVIEAREGIYRLAEDIGRLDCLANLALIGRERGYCIPEIHDGDEIDIVEGRHPIVETKVDNFVPNDCHINREEASFLIITGPNMAGKSTFIRQVALIVIFAQMGAPVSAKEAKIGIVDRIFARIGAQDEIFKGQSTFMVEMSQTAGILHNLSPKSLVILDEIGRGTSTYDGLAIAWAVSEFLAQRRIRSLFATHFHELTELEDRFSGVKNYNVAVKEWNDEVIFLHQIVPGGADRSYGIHVAKIAGLPEEVIRRAKEVLVDLEGRQVEVRDGQGGSEQIPLFEPPEKKLARELAEVDPNTITPIEALNLIFQWKKYLG